MYKVLITTSGTGSRLGNLTKYTNKSLIRVGKKPAISYIIEKYPENIELVITLGYFGNQVKNFLSLAYPNRKFSFVNVDKYEGEGASLLYSMSCAKDQLQCPFIFHACDTLITDNEIPTPLEENWLMGNHHDLNNEKPENSYRGFDINIQTDQVYYLLEKDVSRCYDYMGVCGIKDYEVFWNKTSDILSKDINNSSLSDCDTMNVMMRHCVVRGKIIDNWFDIGNIESLSYARTFINDSFHLLDKEDESIFLFDDFVIKFFSNNKICQNRIERNKILGNCVPKILASTDNFYKYEYAKGDLLSEVATPELINNLLKYANKNLWIKTNDNFSFIDKCKDFYYDKTLKRIKDFLKNTSIEDKEESINGKLIKPIIKLLDEAIKFLFKDYKDFIPSGFHGDFILDNMLIDEDKFIFLDWRQDFAGDLTHGDAFYDLAKLNHNFIVNHDLIAKNLFSVKESESGIYVDILISNRLKECQEAFNRHFNKTDLKRINILTALIWLNMSPLHEPNLGKFLYYFGKYNLQRILEIEDI